jgi:MFS family permease
MEMRRSIEGESVVTDMAESSGAPAFPSRAVAWRSTVIIFIITAIATADRMAISVLIGPIKAEFGIGDFQASLLVGAAFTSFYILFLLPIGWAADKWSRTRVLAICLFLWSLATVACGWATGFAVLFGLRMLVGAGEAGMAPTVHGIIGDSFPKTALAKPLAVQGIGFQIGAALGAAAAGAVVSAAATGAFAAWPLVGAMEGWRLAFVAVGLPGIIALILIPLLHDPRDQRRAATPASPQEPVMPFLRQHKALMLIALLFSGISAMALGCVTAWIPEYLQRTQGFSPQVAGATMGGLLLVAAFAGQGLYAVITDWLSARGVKDAAVRVGILPIALAIPLAWFAFAAGNGASFTGWLLAFLLCVAPCNAITNTVMQSIAPTPLRSRISAITILTVSLIGFTLGPALVGALSEYVFGEARLGTAIQLVLTGAMVFSLLLMLALRPRLARHLA